MRARHREDNARPGAADPKRREVYWLDPSHTHHHLLVEAGEISAVEHEAIWWQAYDRLRALADV
jgi:hypothetical protein